MSINNITGDKIQTKPSTKEFEEGWERVFGKKKSRIDIIGSNGNDGLHYITDNLPINEYPNNSNDEVSS